MTYKFREVSDYNNSVTKNDYGVLIQLSYACDAGKGRFGKVLRASAYSIVPKLPSVNTVAVKMAISSKYLHSVLD